jgi:hypothetical protein
LIPDETTQIEVRLSRLSHARVTVSTGNSASKILGEGRVNLEAAYSNRRAQCRVYRFRPRPQRNHRANTFRRDSGERTPPPRMQRCGDMAIVIDHQYRHAVGGEDAEGETTRDGDHPIALASSSIFPEGIFRLIDSMDKWAVDLTHPRNR